MADADAATSLAHFDHIQERRSHAPIPVAAQRTGWIFWSRSNSGCPGCRAGVWDRGQLGGALSDRCVAVHGGTSALGVCVPAEEGSLPQSGRAVVEDPALSGVEGTAVRELGGGVRGGRRGGSTCKDVLDSLSAGAASWHRHSSKSSMNLPDEPLSNSITLFSQLPL